MENKENQGCFAQAEQQWICPDCETVNTGDNCTICGCPRPRKKQEDSAQKTATEQGRYQEAVQEWICPDCETRNTGAICAACGRPRPEPKGTKKRVSKKAVIAAVAAVVILISTLVGIAVWLPYHRYQNASSLLESGQYEQAYQAFSAMSGYRNSSFLRNQAILKWATELKGSGNYEKALEVLELLPDDAPVTSLYKDIQYNYALQLKRARDYKGAYLLFSELGDYESTKFYMDRTVLDWSDSILSRSDREEASVFQKTVILTVEQSKQIYKKLCRKQLYTYDYVKSDGTESWSFNDYDFAVRGILLEMLPANAYDNIAELKMLFSQLDADHPDVFLREHRDILDTLWDAPVVQNIIVNYYCFDEWLLGTWQTENRQYTLKFEQDKSDPDTIYSTIDIPWVSKPAGTAHWAIKNMTYVWTDEDDNILAEVYRFKLLEPDKIEVYAFKNQKTYTLVRK